MTNSGKVDKIWIRNFQGSIIPRVMGMINMYSFLLWHNVYIITSQFSRKGN